MTEVAVVVGMGKRVWPCRTILWVWGRVTGSVVVVDVVVGECVEEKASMALVGHTAVNYNDTVVLCVIFITNTKRSCYI